MSDAADTIRAKVARTVRQQASEPVRDEPLRDEPRKTRKRKGDVDEFYIPAEMIPPGVSYEWKRYTTMGQHDPGYDVSLRENGWEPVDVARHPQFMPPGYNGPIIRKGMILMERPTYLTEEAREEDLSNARNAIRAKEEQLRATPPGTMTRDHPSVAKISGVSKSYEPIKVA